MDGPAALPCIPSHLRLDGWNCGAHWQIHIRVMCLPEFHQPGRPVIVTGPGLRNFGILRRPRRRGAGPPQCKAAAQQPQAPCRAQQNRDSITWFTGRPPAGECAGPLTPVTVVYRARAVPSHYPSIPYLRTLGKSFVFM
jgi:hypothetical protein